MSDAITVPKALHRSMYSYVPSFLRKDGKPARHTLE